MIKAANLVGREEGTFTKSITVLREILNKLDIFWKSY
jgi:hypothetical protein